MNLAAKNNNDFTVLDNGEAFISQTKLAELCGVDQSAISKGISRNSANVIGVMLNENNQLSSDSAFNVIGYYAAKGKPQAVQSLIKIGAAGMRAYIYHEAGYVMKAIHKQSLPGNYIEALKALVVSEEEKQAALMQIEADKPKVEFAMAVRNMHGACSVGDFAKTLGTGRNRFFAWLREIGVLMINNMPYQHHIDRGLFVVIEQTPYTDSKGKAHPAFTTMITGKGQVWLERKYRFLVPMARDGLKKIA